MKQLTLMICRLTCMFLIHFVLFTFSGNATTYFVSTSGNDANPGTSEDLPWKSLARVNNFFKLYPGDQVLFKRGDEWSGTVTVRASGTAGSPIIYGAYGTGDKPKIYGSEKITGWTLHSGNIYKASFNKSINQLFLKDSRMTLARYPNSDNWDFTITAVNSSTQFSCDKLDENINYTGATWIGRTEAWAVMSAKVTALNSNTLTIESAPTYDLGVDEGFFLCNKLVFLDQPGEWFYDTATKTVYLWTPGGDNPANYEVRGSTISDVITLSSKNHITIKDLNLLQAKEKALSANNCSNLIIENNDISDVDDMGIHIIGSLSANNTIANNRINSANHYGIYTYIKNSIISDNEIKNTAIFGNLGKTGLGSQNPGNGLECRGDNNTIRYNRVINTGYNGIRFYGLNTLVEYNYVDNACATVDDGGGIYTYNGTLSNPASAGSIVRYNIVLNINGNWEGRIKRDRMKGFGIYMDANNHDITIEHNIVYNTGRAGLFMLYGGDNMVFRYNTIMSAYAGIMINSSTVGTRTVKKNTIYSLGNDVINNIDQLIVSWTNSTTISDSNTYVNHYNSKNIFVNGTALTYFSDWKTKTGQDANSIFIGTALNEGETEKLFYNDTKHTRTFHMGNLVFRDIYGKVLKDTFTLKPFTSKIVIGKNFEKINQSPTIPDQSFNVVSPKVTNDFIGQVLAHDPDTGQVIDYSIVGGNETELFTIDSLSGKIHAKTNIKASKNMTVKLVVKVNDNAANFLSDSAKIIINFIGMDTTPPVITTFSIPPEYLSLTIPVNSFTATDDVAVTGFILTENSIFPQPEDSRWSATPPLKFTLSNEGNSILHAWVKDAAGNISVSVSAPVKTVPVDMSPTYSEYLYEESEGLTVFDSKGSNNGTFVNEILRDDGIVGRGLKFTGKGFINLGQSFGQNVENGISISTWIKTNAKSRENQGLIFHGGPNGNTFALYLYPLSKSIVFETNGTTNSSFTVDNVTQLWDENWHHLLVTYNGFEKKIYLDNVILGRIYATGKIDNGWGHVLFIGAGEDETSPALLYVGLIDETRIYNYALNSDEIRELYETVNKKQALVFIKVNKEPDVDKNIDVYPNPAREVINIRFINLPENGVEIILYDVTGNPIVTRIALSNIEILNIANLPAGVYFIKTSIKNQSKIKKLIIM